MLNMPLTIYQASAGSGKTFKLTEEYLLLLFRKPHAYKNILAVTFTNKATAEMKLRILNELANLAHGKNSPYLKGLAHRFQKSEAHVRAEAQIILKRLLHDYSGFTVETIDRFFQRILRSFLREINLQGTFAIELDQNRVLEEAIENLLLSIDNNQQIREWLLDFANDQIEKGKSWNIKTAVFQLAREIFNEKFQVLGTVISEKIKNKVFLKKYLESLHAIVGAFESKMSGYGKEGLQLMQQHDLTIDDFKNKKAGVAAYFNRLAQKTDFDPKKRAREAVDVYENWYVKTSPRTDAIITACEQGLNAALANAVEHYDRYHVDYNTAKAILRNIYTLGIITDIQQHVRTLCEDENIFLLSDAGAFISQIIAGSDTPFMYEKVGNHFQHYMLDEFQDTSYIQWENFKPLISNSLATGFKNIVVGDVKQSIYRWRNSSWKILAQDIHSSMASFHPDKITLDTNWRSAAEVVKFNNTVFGLAADYLQDLFHTEIAQNDEIGDEYAGMIKQAYDQSVQNISKEIHGLVEVKFCSNDEQEDYQWHEEALENMVLKIRELRKNGVPFSQIAVLIRNQREGMMIADYLMSLNQHSTSDNIPFISNDALKMESSILVTIIIRAFRYLLEPENKFNLYELVFHYCIYIQEKDKFQFHLYEKDTLLQELPARLTGERNQWLHLPLTGMFEEVVQTLGLNQVKFEQAYLYAFADLVKDYSQNKNLSLTAFLDWWDQNGVQQVINTTSDQDAISIVTIHKSKGLEFRSVIVPFCDWDIDHNPTQNNILWCETNVNPFNELELIPLHYSKSLINTHFKREYYEEKIQAFVDNLNLLYVAFTRAKQFLFVTLPNPEQVKRRDKTMARLLFDIMSDDQISEPNQTVLDISAHWQADSQCFNIGSYPSTEMVPGDESELHLLDYPSVTPQITVNIAHKSEQWMQDASEEPSLQLIDEGKMMHHIFEKIVIEDDIDDAVETMAMQGIIDLNQVHEIQTRISQWLKQPEVHQWFKPGQKVKTEASILLSGGDQRRPDRVVFTEEEVHVIDFKFGWQEKPSDITQMKSYVHLLQTMGYDAVKGFIWYAQLNVIREVALK
jgi:ATP-dependent exoDNAse (exonuclease V) beta subunit